MAINNSALDEATRTPEKFGILDSIGGPQFIAAQIFTIAATVLGVYLAGYVGFQRTLEYDRFQKAQQQTELLNAVHAELRDNMARIKEFVNRIDPTGATDEGEWPRLRLYVWKAAGQTSAAFDIPPVALSGMQNAYEEIGETLGNPRAKEWFRGSNSFFFSDRSRFKDTLDKNVKLAESTLLPALQSAIASSSELISKYTEVGR